MNEVLPVLVVTVAGAVPGGCVFDGATRGESGSGWPRRSLMHVGFASAQVPAHAQLLRRKRHVPYFNYGEILAQMMERDPLHVIPEVTGASLAAGGSSPAD